MKTSQKKDFLGGIKKTKNKWKRWCEATEEEEEIFTIQQGHHSPVHRFL